MRDYQRLINQSIGARKIVARNLEQVSQHLKDTKRKLVLLESAQAFLQLVAQDTQEQLKIHVEDIVQLALDAIFPDQYQFEICFQIARGVTTADIVFTSKQSGYRVDPLAASGGGVVDICCFALRLACWTLSRGVDSVMVFDEPFRFLSRDLQERAGILLRELGQKLGLQIIVTTHLAPLIDAADRTIRIVKGKDGISKIEGY